MKALSLLVFVASLVLTINTVAAESVKWEKTVIKNDPHFTEQYVYKNCNVLVKHNQQGLYIATKFGNSTYVGETVKSQARTFFADYSEGQLVVKFDAYCRDAARSLPMEVKTMFDSYLGVNSKRG